jgi:hypothetical protein
MNLTLATWDHDRCMLLHAGQVSIIDLRCKCRAHAWRALKQLVSPSHNTVANNGGLLPSLLHLFHRVICSGKKAFMRILPRTLIPFFVHLRT